MFDLLLESGADATDAFSHAVWGGAYELAESALAHGAIIDRATANGKLLLNDVIRWGQIPQMTWLLATCGQSKRARRARVDGRAPGGLARQCANVARGAGCGGRCEAAG